MGLRLKNGIAVTAVFLAIIAATYLLYSHVLLNEFDSIERERANLNIQRVFQSVEAVTEELQGRVLDWSRWDETYQFMRGKNKEYLSTNVNYEAIAPFELVHAIFLTNSLTLVSGQEVSRDGESLRPLNSTTLRDILGDQSVKNYLTAPGEKPLSGLIRISGEPLFFSIAPITDNQGTAPRNGFLIFTRAFSSRLQTQIKNRTRLDLSFNEVPSAQVDSHAARPETINNSSVEAHGNEMVSVGIIRDINKYPILSFLHRAPRTIYQQGKASRDLVVSLMAICLVLANVVLITFLNRAVIGRLERFAARIKSITSSTDFSTRISPEGSDEIGTLTDTFNALLDTTERTTSQLAQARDTAIRATQAKSDFVAHVSHELRAPIHGLTGLLRILFKGESSPTKRAYIQMAQESATTLLSTINNILDLSKIESGAVDLQHIPFVLRDVLRTALRTVGPRVDEKPDLDFLFDIEPHVPDNVVGDPLRFQQILVNLLGNAAKFTQEGTISLRVSTQVATPTEAKLLFEISDTGIGMSEEQLARIFTPYLQGDETIQTRYEGTGLGLSIVTSLAEQLGGEISVDSASQQGSTFRVLLPFKLQDSASTPRAIHAPRRCVFITHTGRFSSWMIQGLARYNCAVDVVAPTAEADLHTISTRSPRPDIVLLSPKAMETPTVIENLRALRSSLSCPIVVSLKASDMTAHERIQALGDFTVVDTPTSPEEVLNKAWPSGTRITANPSLERLPTYLGAERRRVLVADDAPTSRLIIQEMLEEAGHEVETVKDGAQLLRRVQDESQPPISLILTDIEMPNMGGLEVTREIRKLESADPTRDRLPIVAITAHALIEEQRKFRDGGIDYVITKPLKPADLAEALKNISSRGEEITVQPTIPAGPTKSLSAALCDLTARLWGEVAPGASSPQISEPSRGIDIAEVFERSGESPRRTKLILSEFLGSYREPLLKLQQACHTSDLKEATVAAHSLKGLLLDVGATRVAGLAASIEGSLKGGDYTTAIDTGETFTKETTQIATLIERVVRHFPSV